MLLLFSAKIERYVTDPQFNANIFFANGNDDATLGISLKIGKICSSILKYRIGIVEWTKMDLLTGEVKNINFNL